MTLTPQALLLELDTTLPETSEEWRGTALRKVADLFFAGAESYSEQQVAVFDAVMCRLIPNADRPTLSDLSTRLAEAPQPPPNVLAILARHLDVAVCGPIVERAHSVPDKVLVEIAEREHPNLVARIAARPQLSETVCDVLLKRGGPATQRMLIDNPAARISDGGFARVIMGLGGNKEFAQAVAARSDVPAELRPWLNEILNPKPAAAPPAPAS